MKKLLICAGLACAIVMSAHNTVLASDWNWSAGVKSWYSNINIEYDGSIAEREGEDAALLVGPEIKLSNGSFFGGVSALFSASKYKFEDGFELSRTDLDAVLGYMVHPRFGVFTGYKRLAYDSGTRYDCGIVGAGVNMPLKSFTFILNGAYFPYVKSNWSNTDDFTGWSIEPGVSYNFFQNNLFYAGYKYQQFNQEFGDVTFDGFLISYNYQF